MSTSSLHWAALAMAATLAYTAWYSKRGGDSARDVKALWCACGLCLMLSALGAGIAYWPSD